MGIVRVKFEHGLGDCVYFAHQVPLYVRRGWDVMLWCEPDKGTLFRAAGASIADEPDGALPVPWYEGELPNEDLRFDNYWRWSKLARNLSLEPMPDLGNPADLWSEYCAVSLNAGPFICGPGTQPIRRYLGELPTPRIVLHTQGATDGGRKNVPTEVVREICRELLSSTDGAILILDSDTQVPQFAHWRVRHVLHDYGALATLELLALLDGADVVIGIDSGPLHVARFTSTPAIGIWMKNGCPATWSLPRRQQVNIVVGCESRCWTRHARVPFNIVECDEEASLAATLGRTVRRMLAGCRYLLPEHVGRDILLQQFVLDWQGGAGNAFGGFNDRDRGFDCLLKAAAERYERPRVVEAGCVREEEDFRGAGFSTLLLGLFAASRGGELISIDHNGKNCEFARRTVAPLAQAVDVVESDSVAWLARNKQVIDVLYLDSRDTDLHGCEEHALAEIQAAQYRLHKRSLVAFDDTCYRNGSFKGAGALGVPWLLARGWRVLHSGHQTILSLSEG